MSNERILVPYHFCSNIPALSTAFRRPGQKNTGQARTPTANPAPPFSNVDLHLLSNPKPTRQLPLMSNQTPRRPKIGPTRPRGRATRLAGHETKWLSGLLPYYRDEIRGNKKAAQAFYTKTTKHFLTVFNKWKPPAQGDGETFYVLLQIHVTAD